MLSDSQDAFGHALYDYLHNDLIGSMTEIIEREDGFVSPDPIRRYFDGPTKWPSHQKRSLRWVRGRVLDAGSGAGRHTLYLQGKGLEVVALDNSPLALDVCRKRGVKKTMLLPFQKLGRETGQFDTILMLGGNFGLFGNVKRAHNLLGKLATMTSSKARIIAETGDVSQTDVPEHLSYQQSNRQRGRLPGQIRNRVRYRAFVGPWFDYLQVSKQELERILFDTQWKVSKYLDTDRAAYIAILEKKARV